MSYKILIADDEPNIVISLEVLMKKEGFQVAIANDGEEALARARGLETLVLDQTRPDTGVSVAKVIVPGLRQFWARFAPGRLYDVPVELGWQARPLRENQLNPVHLFM